MEWGILFALVILGFIGLAIVFVRFIDNSGTLGSALLLEALIMLIALFLFSFLPPDKESTIIKEKNKLEVIKIQLEKGLVECKYYPIRAGDNGTGEDTVFTSRDHCSYLQELNLVKNGATGIVMWRESKQSTKGGEDELVSSSNGEKR